MPLGEKDFRGKSKGGGKGKERGKSRGGEKPEKNAWATDCPRVGHQSINGNLRATNTRYPLYGPPGTDTAPGAAAAGCPGCLHAAPAPRSSLSLSYTQMLIVAMMAKANTLAP